MLTCPMCKKKLVTRERECPTCRADLSLLVDYAENLEAGLKNADQHARAGRLGDAVQAYLAVLDVDPENPEAKRQVGRVASAVRHFDSTPRGIKPREEGWSSTIWLLIVLGATLLGLACGMQVERWIAKPPSDTQEQSRGE